LATERAVADNQTDTPPAGPVLQVRAVTKVYRQGQRDVQALRGVDLDIAAGTMVAIMGPSGSGKSTLLHLLGGLDRATSGQVLFQGRDLGRLGDAELTRVRRRTLGFVFQFFNLLPTLTVAENVALPLILDGTPRRRALEQAHHKLGRLRVVHRAEHFPEELSGGEMQRVAIARALVAGPTTLLCDEPTGNLDSANATEVLKILRELVDGDGCTIVLVTHDPGAAAVGDRTVRLRDGLVESAG
jgi:putative ABC transport system ATP-binding protein